MAVCPKCGSPGLAAEDIQCPTCNEQVASSNVSRDLARATGDEERAEKAGRIVSSVGPALPANPPPIGDTAPTGWLARLDAAREQSDGPPPIQPPPLKNNPAEPPSTSAASLADQLEKERDQKKSAQEARIEAAFEEIERIEFTPPPTRPPRSHVGPKTWAVVVCIVVGGLGFLGFQFGFSAPPPEPDRQIDPRLARDLARRKEAIRLLEEGNQLVERGKGGARKAVQKYEKALDLEPNLPKAMLGLGIAFAKAGETRRALEHYRRYLKMAPDADDADKVRAIIKKHKTSQR